MAWLAAPHPRPPHPTKPTLSLSLPAAYTALASAGVINAAPAMAAADVVMNRRRLWLGRLGCGYFFLLRFGHG